MTNLVFVRHSQTQPNPDIPSRLWGLTAEGRRRCVALARQLIPYNLDVIVTSEEAKAMETGELVAQELGVPWWVMANLHEHQRETVPYFGSHEEFLGAVSRLFSRPNELVFGDETAHQAGERFVGAVKSVLAIYPQENIAIVTHGTVLSLFVGQLAEVDVFSFWRSLGMPAFVAFRYPAMELLALVNEIR
jgi:broad specificity phosphatase PhoE